MLPTFMATKRNQMGAICIAVPQVVANARAEPDILTGESLLSSCVTA
jgi:hypothetical protein